MLLASGAFYLLIAFEFFYMASPFAAYFYAVYGPGLDGLQAWGLSGWMLWFFLPHIVAETKSALINITPVMGLLLFFGGLLGFAGGAFQVYRAKIRKQGAVTGGLYRYIRHPQYTALIIASLGMLLIWPRFLVLYSTIAMVFAYAVLARVEERICADAFADYDTYLSSTGGFFPKLFVNFRSPRILAGLPRTIVYLASSIALLVAATLIALGVRQHAIASLYSLNDEQGIYLSITRLTESELSQISAIARAHPNTDEALGTLKESDRFIAYVLPTQMYVSEIPMVLPEGEAFGHSVPDSRDHARYKVIYTRAEFSSEGLQETESILYHALNKHALIEVHVNLSTEAVEHIPLPPEKSFYPDIQVPVFYIV
jgi:protein-S-isoprenylcysteine O-methyltransferase Ste14